MGESLTTIMMLRSICFLFAIALAFAAANVDEISANEDSFAEAEAFVQSFSSENAKGDSACLKVANDSIKVIDDACKALQATVDKAAQANQACCDEGRSAVCSAKAQLEAGKAAHTTCITELTKLKKTDVNMGTVSYESLAGKSCYNYNDNSSFKSVKSKVDAKSTECTKKDGTKGTTKKAYDIAVSDASKDRQSCNSNTAKALDQAFKTASASCSSATNKKSFIRAEHMKCVLAGTALEDCNKNMPPAPTLKKTDLSTLSCAAQTGASSGFGSGGAAQCMSCKWAKGKATVNGVAVISTYRKAYPKRLGSWDAGCRLGGNYAKVEGVSTTLKAKYDPYNAERIKYGKGKYYEGFTRPAQTGNIMWGFKRASHTLQAGFNKASHSWTNLDYAMFCNSANAKLAIYEIAGGKNTGQVKQNLIKNVCVCGVKREFWLTIEANGLVKYYMINSAGKQLCYTSKKKAEHFPYVVDTSLYGAHAKVYDMKVTRGQ